MADKNEGTPTPTGDDAKKQRDFAKERRDRQDRRDKGEKQPGE